MSSSDSLSAVSFSNFVVTLASTAMVQLGAAPHPETGETALDLAQARHVIDLLGVLEAKTEGNLDADEAKLLASVLAELRTKFVALSHAHTG